MTSVRRGAVAGLGAVLLTAALLLAGCGSLPQLDPGAPLESSSAPEHVARVLRLAGITQYRTGIDGSTAFAQVTVPTADSAAEVGGAWMAAIAGLREAFPGARAYKVLVIGPEEAPLIELAWDGRAARGADLAKLREDAKITYPETADGFVSADPLGELASQDATAAYLDAKNRAAGISTRAARTAWLAMQRQAPGFPAPGEGEDATVAAAKRAAAALEQQEGDSAQELLAIAQGVAPGGDSGLATSWRHIAASAESLNRGGRPDETYFSAVSEVARQVGSRSIAAGPKADTVLVAAQSADAPAGAGEVASFEPVPELDASGTASGTALPNLVASALGAGPDESVTVVWPSGSANPEQWRAYRSADGRVFWRSGPSGIVALVDSSLRGMVFQTRSADLVDAANTGIVLVTIPLP